MSNITRSISNNITKSVLITGASGGIGSAAARCFAKAGYSLILLGHSHTHELETLRDELRDITKVTVYSGDVSDTDFVDTVFKEIQQLDVLVNNAGMPYFGLLQDMDITDWHRIMDVNLTSVFLFSKKAIPLMLRSGHGHIINVSSIWGECGASMEAAYSASKGGMNALTKALAKELAPSNIQVNALSCGVIDTAMNRCLSPEELEALQSEIPADRFGDPLEAARTLLFLAEAPEYLTGQIIGLNGGFF